MAREIGFARRQREVTGASLHERREVGRFEALDGAILRLAEGARQIEGAPLLARAAEAEAFAGDIDALDDVVVGERGGAGEDVAELAHVARPRLRARCVERLGVDRHGVVAESPASRGSCSREERDVLARDRAAAATMTRDRASR